MQWVGTGRGRERALPDQTVLRFAAVAHQTAGQPAHCHPPPIDPPPFCSPPPPPPSSSSYPSSPLSLSISPSPSFSSSPPPPPPSGPPAADVARCDGLPLSHRLSRKSGLIFIGTSQRPQTRLGQPSSGLGLTASPAAASAALRCTVSLSPGALAPFAAIIHLHHHHLAFANGLRQCCAHVALATPLGGSTRGL